MMRFAGNIKAELISVQAVFTYCYPFKIVRTVIILDSIFMVYLMQVGWRFSMKRLAY